MRACEDCGRVFGLGVGCTKEELELRDGTHLRVRFGREREPWKMDACGDCWAAPGKLHHLGCDIEECPRCHEQLFSCDCWPDEDREPVLRLVT